MKTTSLVLFVFICLSTATAMAQKVFVWDYRYHGLDHYDKEWSVTLGVNVLDDSGAQLERAPRPPTDWNFSHPFLLGAEYYYNNLLSLAGAISFNKMNEGKNIDSSYVIEGHEATYFAADLGAKLYGRDFLKSYFFDPYVLAGLGYTSIGAYKAVNEEGASLPIGVEIDDDGNLVVPKVGRMTVNVGWGFNFWFNRSWAFTTGFMAKWGLDSKEHSRGSNSISNQLQYTFGVTYFIKENSIRFTSK